MFGPGPGQIDVLSVRLVPASTGEAGDTGPVDVETGLGFLASVRKLLIAAAKASGDVRLAHYGQANRSLARRYLEATTLGLVADGGTTIEVHAVVDADADADRAELSLLPPVEPAPPFPRIVGFGLVEALGALVSVLDDHQGPGRLDRIGTGVEAGVSVELCEAIADLVATGGDVAVGFRPGDASTGSAGARPLEVVVPGRLGPVLLVAAEALRASTGGTEATITGEVTDLARRDQPDGSGTVTLRSVDPDPPARTVKVRVGPQRYRDAIAAHRSNRTIVVRGTLVRQANTHWIDAPVSFRIGPAPEPAPADDPLPLDLEP